ncbi:MAG: DUF3048 domain-containing protein [Candidatus Nomurabacteria bacterium]|jgi:hypothetical protein|nr:DUF3048 domain-containing protein [Candidatus Nomurabacteria bacterium]
MKLLKPDPIGVAAEEPPKRSKKTSAFIKKHWKLEVGIVAVVAIVAGAVFYLIAQNSAGEFGLISKTSNDAKPVYYATLTGKKVGGKAEETHAVTAIMIENSPDARPQSGLKDSGVVFEAIAEGGITRFLVLYQTEKPQLIGPVRSVRLYYVDWLTPYQASVAHVGGSAAALNLVRNGSYRDIDQFFNAGFYWRATDRYAPHNVYTKFELLDELNKAKGYTKSEFAPWPRQTGKAAKEPNATSIHVTISSELYNSLYTYDTASNKYLRSHEYGGAHLDREQGQIAPDTVIVMKVNQSRVNEDGTRESIETSGSGAVYIFQNGVVTEGIWAKTSREAMIEFKDSAGKQVKLNRGQTWVTAIPNSSGNVAWQ